MVISKSFQVIRSNEKSKSSYTSAAHYPIELAIGHSPAPRQEPPEKMERVIIIGSSGSGKSTLARALGEKTGLPVVHLDLHFWHPGWVGTPDLIWQEKIHEMVRQPKWILDGNYRRTLDTRLQAADTVVFLDLPRWLCAWRAIRRRMEYRQIQRPDMAVGCKETLFSPDFPGFLVRIWQYPDRARPDIMGHLSRLDASKRIVHLRTRTETYHFLAAPEHFSTLTPINQMIGNV